MEVVEITRRLGRKVGRMRFADPVAFVYNPLSYAFEPHEEYLRRFGAKTGRVVLLGMNPGPFGMVQTGVPFGEVGLVRDWMGIEGRVTPPKKQHPKRPVLGFDCERSEVSGARLWGWARDRFGKAERFFDRFFVINYCPLAFTEDSGRNRIPEKLPAAEREPLFAACDAALRNMVDALAPALVVGIGAFAEKRAKKVLNGIPIGSILHPSPASPKANRGWAEAAEQDFARLGISVG